MKFNLMENIRNLTFGTELELCNISRAKAAKAVQSVVGGTVEYHGGTYSDWRVTQPDGRVWKCMSDASVTGHRAGRYGTDSEVVTPVLTYADMPQLQEVVRALRAAGAKADDSTSQHVHVGVRHLSPAQIANACKIFYKQEKLILKAAGTLEYRLCRWCQYTRCDFAKALERRMPETLDDLNRMWWNRDYVDNAPYHYDPNRYHDLNLNNIWRESGTMEFRLFNGTTHAGEVKANITLALAIVAKGAAAKAASVKAQREFTEASAKYDMRVFLLSLGMIGDEFKTAREHLLKRLPGDAGFKTHDQRPA